MRCRCKISTVMSFALVQIHCPATVNVIGSICTIGRGATKMEIGLWSNRNSRAARLFNKRHRCALANSNLRIASGSKVPTGLCTSCRLAERLCAP